MKNYNEMTVPELREECRSRGIPRQESGKKLTKTQLIERLEKADEETKEMFEDVPVVEERKEEEKETTKEEQREVDIPEERVTYNMIAPKICEVIEKYKGTLETDEIVPGVHIAYVRHIETRSGKFLRKIGTAVVVNTKRASRIAKIETPLGVSDVQNFDDFLYVRKTEYDRYPDDIIEILALQRKEREQFLEWKRKRNRQ